MNGAVSTEILMKKNESGLDLELFPKAKRKRGPRKKKAAPPPAPDADGSSVPKYILNPAYDLTAQAQREKENIKRRMGEFGECVEDYYPEDYGKRLPEEGAWIMLLMTVNVGKEIAPGVAERITVPHLSIWYALPKMSGVGERFGVRPTLGAIQTPQGEVSIWPHEYTVVKDLSNYLEMTEEEGFYIHFMREEGAFDVDRLFYLMSRGIPKGEAQRLLLPELNDPFFCYFTFHESYCEFFGEGFGSPYLTAANHERRAAARREHENASAQ